MATKLFLVDDRRTPKTPDPGLSWAELWRVRKKWASNVEWRHGAS